MFVPLFAALLLGLPFAPAAAPAPTLGLGIGLDGADAMTAAGVAPDHVQTWAGWWNTYFLGLGEEAADAQRRGATLVVEWYYWGDPLRPECWQTACEGRTVEAWRTKTAAMADVLAASNASVVVVLESEFNKNGIADPANAPAFDAALADVARILHERAPRVQVALGFGAWGFEQWANFPLALAESDLVGIQAMAAVPRQGVDGVVGLPQKTLDVARAANATFGKPVIVHDIAIASYGEGGDAAQAQAVQGFVEAAESFAAAGVTALVYRAWTDAPQAGHFGAAEGTFGLATMDGTTKPSWDAWVAGVHRERARTR